MFETIYTIPRLTASVGGFNVSIREVLQFFYIILQPINPLVRSGL